MKIIAKPVKAIAVFDYDGTITPCKFKYKKSMDEEKEVVVENILFSERHKIAGVDNLKTLATLLNVSIDYLLDNGKPIDSGIIREPYNLSDYGEGSKKQKKDRVIREKYPNTEIHTLIGKVKLTKGEKVIDNVLGFFTDAPFGTPDLINSFKNLDKEFYIVLQGDKQFFVTVTDEFIESRRLVKHIVADKFELGNWEFVKCKHEVK